LRSDLNATEQVAVYTALAFSFYLGYNLVSMTVQDVRERLSALISSLSLKSDDSLGKFMRLTITTNVLIRETLENQGKDPEHYRLFNVLISSSNSEAVADDTEDGQIEKMIGAYFEEAERLINE
jgi:hypothetical protein